MVINDGTVSYSGFSDDHLMQSQTPQEILLSSLPPLLLHLILPSGYPLFSPPKIVSLRATHSWFSRLPDIQETLLKMWQAGEGVLYNWVELIRTAEFFSSLDLDQDNIIRCVVPAIGPQVVR